MGKNKKWKQNKPQKQIQQGSIHDAVEQPKLTPLKIIFVLICLGLIISSGLTIYRTFVSPNTGWDYRVYMASVQSIDQGENPYIHENLMDYPGMQTDPLFVYGYPPHTLLLFKLISIFNSILFYRILCIVLICISIYLALSMITTPHRIIFFATIMASGFISLYWNFMTGNDSLVFLLFTSIILYLLSREKFDYAAIATGLMASFSVYPILFSAIFLFVKGTIKEKIRWIGISGLTLAIILGLSAIFNFELFQNFLTQFLNTGALKEVGSMGNPTPYLMFWTIAEYSWNDIIFVGLLTILYISSIIFATYKFSLKYITDNIKLYSIGWLAIFMLLPRIKPYAFVMILIPLYFLFKDYNYKIQFLAIGIISMVPMIVYEMYWINSKFFPMFVTMYAQTISLILIFILLIFYDFNES